LFESPWQGFQAGMTGFATMFSEAMAANEARSFTFGRV
jgi:hypothetical protein